MMILDQIFTVLLQGAKHTDQSQFLVAMHSIIISGEKAHRQTVESINGPLRGQQHFLFIWLVPFCVVT